MTVCESKINIENLTFKTLEDSELYEMYIDRNTEDPWYKLDQLKTENFKYFKGENIFPYLPASDEKHIFFCAIDNDKIIGLIKLKIGGKDSLYYPGWKNWICFIDILPEYQGNGISRKLTQMMFKYAEINSLDILTSGYTKEGFERVKKIFNEESKNYNVKFLDDRDRVEF